ncbi:hypothetical protein PCYB_002770 [Plasmodium cynomolgi strain B]|uniref:Pv-fam-d protein n=1 Tax=Plasmodium cynomolgi (strain B) TaxID=1120755 RepID=K6UNI5_PLACD|nr:hypothetical protein PCYB_002770 [Plasmodium cynomolgi strain B]GAB69528.1 hypothetical protein PCYB_002770 [Plasmodium cynomolgi strain B]
MPCNVKSCINISSNKRCGRMLTADEKNRTREQNNVNLQKRIKTLLDEDDNTFGERLNKLAYDDNFRKQFNKLLQVDLFQKRFNKLMQDMHFRKHFNKLICNNNFEKHFSISPDADYSNHDHYNPFKFSNNLEEFFDELKSKNYYKAKIIDELKRHEECKTQPKNEMKRTNNLKREQIDEVEDYMSSKLEKDDISERSFEGHVYKGLVKPRKRSTLSTFLKKADKIFEAEVKRFLKKRAAGRYSDKGRGIIGKFFSLIDKYRLFIPVLLFFPFTSLAITIIIFGITVLGPAVLGLFPLATAGITSGLGLFSLAGISSLLGLFSLGGLMSFLGLFILTGLLCLILPLVGLAVLVYYVIKSDSGITWRYSI